MATATNLDIIVRLKNEASAALKKVQADVSGLGKALGGISVGQIGVIAAGIGLTASAMTDLALKAAEVEKIANAFDRLSDAAGQSGNTILLAMRKASAGLVTDADLMLSANRALLAGVADTSQEMSALWTVALAQSQATGDSITDTFDNIVKGISKKSGNLAGITVDVAAVMQQYANSLGIAANQLTDTQRKQAMLNEVMRRAVDLKTAPIDNAATAIQRMNVATENAQIALGTLFGPAVATGAQAVADATNQMVTALQLANGEIVGLDRTMVSLQQRAEQLGGPNAQFSMQLFGGVDAAQQKQAFLDLAAGLEEARAAMAAGVPTGKAWVDTLSRLADESLQAGNVSQSTTMIVETLRGAMSSTAVATDTASTAMRNNVGAAAAMASGLSQVQAQAGATTGIIYNLAGAINTLNGISASRPDALDSVIGQINGIAGGLIDNLGIDAALAKGDELKVQSRERAAALREAGYAESDIALILQSELATTQAWASELDKVATQSVPAISQEFANLKSTVESVLSGALDTGVGFSAEDILPREDAINENARRLADIAKNGLTGQDWMSEFAQEAPQEFAAIMRAVAEGGDAKQAAALILRDFEDGLRTSLIDKEAAKERVKRMIMGEQSMAALATEIAQELATEMGIPLQEAMAAAGAALGVPATGTGEGAAGAGGIANAAPPDMTSQGAAAGTSFVTGFQTTVTGTLLVATMVQQMEGAITSFTTPGQNAGKTWGSGFMSTVETSIAQPLINLLVALVTPGVMAQLGTQTSQTTPP